MPTKKTTGNKLADMMYGTPEGAAFGFFPQMGRRGQNRPPAGPQPQQMIVDDRAMELPLFGDFDMSVPTDANRALSQRIADRDNDLKRQADQDMSPLEKLAGGMQAGRLIGSGLVQAVKSIPTAITQGGKAAEDYIAENIYKPNVPKAYEYAGDVGDFLSSLETDYKIPPILPEAMALQYLAGPATKQAGRAATNAGMSLERRMEPIVNRALEGGGLPSEMAQAMGANTQSNVVKPKDGNWLTSGVGSVEQALKPLKNPMNIRKQDLEREKIRLEQQPPSEQRDRFLAVLQQTADSYDRDVVLNKWVDSNLTNYVKRQMGTPDDPVRKLAEEGIVHMPVTDVVYNMYGAQKKRDKLGQPQLGQSEAAKAWENNSDSVIEVAPAKEYTKPLTDLEKLRGDRSLVDTNPWLNKVAPETPINAVSRDAGDNLGFDHIIDVLNEDLTTGRIRPEQLSKVSMEQAVRRTHEYDQELAAKMNASRAAERGGLPVYKEYPEGYRWIELNKPGSFSAESEMMGHSVRGYEPPKGHPDWTEGSGDSGSRNYGHGGWEAIKSGKAKVYSLVDSKGEPHTTIEVAQVEKHPIGYSLEQGVKFPKDFRYERGTITPEQKQQIYQRAKELFDPESTKGLTDFSQHRMDVFQQAADEVIGKPADSITQIKGKQNNAPNEDYLPFVQDFVKSGKWSDVYDLQNTGLRPTSAAFNETEQAFLRSKGVELKPYIDPEETARYQKLFKQPPAEDMARGGAVHISDDPDVMQLELAGGGGVKALAKLARAPAKSRQQIEAIAERIAPQVTGEYVRESPKSAKTVAGKTQKQFQREKTLPVDIRPNVPERTPEVMDIEKMKDDVVIGVAGDPTATAKTLYSVGDTKLDSPSPQHGGPLYGLYNDDFWASGLNAATGVQNLVKRVGEQYDAPVKGMYVMMGPDSINYAQHFADANLQAIDLSRMTKGQVEQFNKLIRQGSPKSGPRQSFPGIEDKGEAYLQMAMDPELRKHFNALMQQNTVTERLNLPNGNDIRFAITEPSLRDLETGSTGFSMGRMRPDVPSEALQRSTHPTYDYDIPGEFLGQSKYPMPYELSFPDTLKSVRENPVQAPQEFGSFKMVGPRQTIDQQMIDEIKMYEDRMKALTGKKKGGAVHKAARTATMSPKAVQRNNEQQVQNPVNFTENPDAMRLELMQRN